MVVGIGKILKFNRKCTIVVGLLFAVIFFTLIMVPSQANDDGLTKETISQTTINTINPEDTIGTHADTITVCSGSCDYTSIQAAIDNASIGDTINVYNGTYYENVHLKDGIKVQGEGADVTIIDGGGDGHVVTGANNTTIDGFTITNAGGATFGYYGIYCSSASLTITNNTIKDNPIGILCTSLSSPIIRGNVIRDNTGYTTGGTSTQGSGISCGDSSNPLIENNIIIDNSNGISSTDSSPIITNNVIHGNLVAGPGIPFSDRSGICVYSFGTSTPLIINNIITGNERGIWGSGSSSPIISYNNVWNNTYNNYFDVSPGIGDISVDPLFVNPANSDYHLQSTQASYHGGAWTSDADTSPCIDAGDPTSVYDNEPEPNGNRINMGAYGNTSQASKSPIFSIIQAQTDKITYAVDENVIISCIIQNETRYNITADSVKAEILKPDSSIEWVIMLEELVGHYNGTFTNTSLNGIYDITIHANKTGYDDDTAELWFEVSGEVNTPIGTDVQVDIPEINATITFSEVTVSGQTYVSEFNVDPPQPSGYDILSDYYDIVTTAEYTGDITICINYNDSQATNEDNIKILHYEERENEIYALMQESIGGGDTVWYLNATTYPDVLLEGSSESLYFVTTPGLKIEESSFYYNTSIYSKDGEPFIAWLDESMLVIYNAPSEIILAETLIYETNEDTHSIVRRKTMHLVEGFAITLLEIDVDGEKALITITKDGEEVESSVVREGEVFIYKEDLTGNGDVDNWVLKFNLDTVIVGENFNLINISGLKLISPAILEIKNNDDDLVDGYVIRLYSNTICLKLDDDQDISLTKGGIVNLIDDKFRFKVDENGDTGGVLKRPNVIGLWKDVTSSRNTDTNIICGVVTNLSDFVIAEPIVDTMPTAILTQPEEDSYIRGTIDINGTANDTNIRDYTVEWKNTSVDWTEIQNSTVFVSDGTLATWDTTRMEDGNYLIRLTVRDNASNFNIILVNVTIDNTPPNVIVNSPANNSIVNSPNITIIGNVTDNFGIKCSFLCQVVGNGGGGCGGGCGVPPFPTSITINRTVTLHEGWNRLSFDYIDVGGNLGKASIVLTLDTNPPTITIDPVTSPTNLEYQTVTGTMESGATVEVTCPTATVGTVINLTDTRWSVEIMDLSEGMNVVNAVATDNAGNQNTTAATIYLTSTSKGSLSIGSKTAPTNSIVTIPVSVANVENVSGISFDLLYNSSVVTVSSVSANESFTGSSVTQNIDNTNNTTSIVLINSNLISTSSEIPVIDIALNITGGSGSSTSLDLQNVEFSDAEFNPYTPLVVVDGQIIVGIKGDFNGNYRVDIGDVAKVAFMVAGKVPEDLNADFNENGRVDIGDAAKIASYLAGKVSEL